MNEEKFKIINDEENGKKLILKKITEENYGIYELLKGEKNKNIVFIKDVYKDGSEIYAAEELLDGTELNDYVDKKGCLDDKCAYDILRGICGGLKRLHSLGIIHRDIKPSNIIICKNGDVKLIDFGISRKRREGASQDTVIMGTEGFASPEQYGFEQTDITADVYSVGVVLNYMLTGKHPSEKLCSGRFAAVVDKCLQLDPENRYQNIAEFEEDIYQSYNGRINFYVNIRNIPGFRTGSKIKAAFAFVVYAVIVGYVFVAFLLVVNKQFREAVSVINSAFAGILLPFFIAADYNNFQERSPLTKCIPATARRILFIAAAILIALIVPNISHFIRFGCF